MGACLRVFAVLFGIVFIAAGVAGFIPSLVTDGKLLNLFTADSMHSIVRLAIGVLALLCSTNAKIAKVFFIIIGLVFAALAVLGFMHREDLIMNMHMNMNDNYLHTGLAVVALFLGFFCKARSA